MPTLLDIQVAVCRSIVDRDDDAAAALILAGEFPPSERLSIYRGTFIGSLTTALRLSYPAVHKLVGGPFFESAAAHYVEKHHPKGSYLDEYGSTFAAFLSEFAPAASIPYLSDVARLEWAVNRAIHAADTAPLDLQRLASMPERDQARVCLIPHPSVSLVASRYPIDAVWQAVLDGDDDAMAEVDLNEGPVRLLVQRVQDDPQIKRMDDDSWLFAADLFAGRSLHDALEVCPTSKATELLAEHFAAGRFVDFQMRGETSSLCSHGDTP